MDKRSSSLYAEEAWVARTGISFFGVDDVDTLDTLLGIVQRGPSFLYACIDNSRVDTLRNNFQSFLAPRCSVMKVFNWQLKTLYIQSHHQHQYCAHFTQLQKSNDVELRSDEQNSFPPGNIFMFSNVNGLAI